MNTRLLAVAALAAAGFGLNAFGVVKVNNVLDEGDAIQILPQEVGEYRKTAQSWRNAPQRWMIEEGAMYSDGKGVLVQLDFFRRDSQSHNGLGCYLGQGESLLWEHLQQLPTLNGKADFDLGLTQTKEMLRLVAASECRAGGCSEVPLPLWKQLSDFKRLVLQLFAQPGDAVVPVSIVLTVPATTRDPALEAALIHQLQTFIAALDLEPARKLAALQGGQNKQDSGPAESTKISAASE